MALMNTVIHLVGRLFLSLMAVLSLILAAATARAADQSEVQSPASTQSSGCGLTVRTGYQTIAFTLDGLERQAVIFVPSSYSGKNRMPVVFDLHGSNSFPKDQMARSHWPDVAEENGFLVVAPQGGLSGKTEGTHAWNVPGVTDANGPDDVAYLAATLTTLKSRFCVDSSRFYASGYSGGGRMLSQFICNGHGDFAAAGFVMSLRAGVPQQQSGKWLPDPASCRPQKPISIIAIWGLKDNTNPYSGGGRPYWQYDGTTALARWAELDGCQDAPQTLKAQGMSATRFTACANGTSILSYTITDQTHDWPGKEIIFPVTPNTGASSRNTVKNGTKPALASPPLYAAERMWAFFVEASDGLWAADKGNCLSKTQPILEGDDPSAKTAMHCTARLAKDKTMPTQNTPQAAEMK